MNRHKSWDRVNLEELTRTLLSVFIVLLLLANIMLSSYTYSFNGTLLDVIGFGGSGAKAGELAKLRPM